MRAANIFTSKRLQRVCELLSDGQEHTTRDIIRDAHVCAVNSCIAELRENSFDIECRKVSQGVYAYRLANFQLWKKDFA